MQGALQDRAGIAFIALRLHDYGAGFCPLRFDCLVVGGGAGPDLRLVEPDAGLAWWNLLGQFGTRSSCRWAVRVYG